MTASGLPEGNYKHIYNKFHSLQKNCKQTTVDYRPTVDYKSAAQYRTFSTGTTGTTGTTVVCCSLLQSAEEGPRFADVALSFPCDPLLIADQQLK